MKLAVTYKDGQVFQHFGHTEMFKIFDIEDGKIINSSVVFTNGQGHGALAGFLKEQGVTSLICGGIGGGAQNALAQAKEFNDVADITGIVLAVLVARLFFLASI